MNNLDVKPAYKGRYLKDVISESEFVTLHIDAGTVLIQDVGGLHVYFQNKSDYRYLDEETFLGKKNIPMSILTGSAVDGIGRLLPDSTEYVIAQHVRFPTDEELEWYEKQNTI